MPLSIFQVKHYFCDSFLYACTKELVNYTISKERIICSYRSNNKFTGFLVGPLLKRYSYRKVAFFGSLLSCSGLIITSQADSMLYIICSYSVLGGIYNLLLQIVHFHCLGNKYTFLINNISMFYKYNLFYDRSRYRPCHGLLLCRIEYVLRQKTWTSSGFLHGGNRAGNDGRAVGK